MKKTFIKPSACFVRINIQYLLNSSGSEEIKAENEKVSDIINESGFSVGAKSSIDDSESQDFSY